MKAQTSSSVSRFYGIAFAIPFCLVLTVMVIGGYCPFGDRSMLYSDMYHQYYPFFVAFHKALRNGEGLLYTWSAGLGMDYLSLIAYYLASPLNLLSVLVPEGLTLEFFSLLVPVKLGLASLFFAIFLRHSFDKADLSIALFGGMYGLCAWALGYQWNVMWLDTFALLPLTVLGTVKLLRDKSYLLYTLTLFLSIAANYYIGLFVCVFIAFVFFFYEICRWQGLRRFFADFCRIGIFTLLAIGMTAFLELPALAGLQNTQSSVNSFPTTFRLNIASEHTIKGMFLAMAEVAGNMAGGLEPTFKEGLPNLYCGIGTVVLAMLFLMGRGIHLRDKLCCVFMLLFLNVSCIIRQLDYIWHGFHFTNMIPYRFTFLYSFVLLYMAYRAWLQREQYRLWQLLLAAVVGAGLFACSESRLEPAFLAFNGGFLVLYVGGMVYCLPDKAPDEAAPDDEHWEYAQDCAQWQRTLTRVLCTLFALELVANVVNFGVRFPSTGITNYPKGTTDAAAAIEYMKELEGDNLFYRAETTHSQTLNDGALNGYYGISTFTSSANVKVTEFMKALGYGAKNTYNRYCFEQGSPVSNLFLGLKYMLERDGNPGQTGYFTPVFTQGKVSLLRNQYDLPLGFLSNQALANLDWSGTDHFSFQNQLFTASTGIDTPVWSMVRNYTIATDGVSLDLDEGGWYCRYSEATSGSSITYEFTADRNGLMCLDLDVTDRNSYTVSKNGQQLYSESLSLPQMVSVCDVAAGDTVQVKFTCKSGEDGNMTVKAAIADTGVFYEGYEILSASTLELTQFRSTHVEGTIQCDRNGLLYTSIPQNGYWHVYVDGQEVEPTLVGDVMVGVYLTDGSHSVVFDYQNTAFSYGWKISLGCALGLIIALLIYHPNRKKGKYARR